MVCGRSSAPCAHSRRAGTESAARLGAGLGPRAGQRPADGLLAWVLRRVAAGASPRAALAARVRWRRCRGLAAVHPRGRDVGRRRAARAPVHERELGGAGVDSFRHAGAAGKIPAADPQRSRHLVPGLLRTLGRLRSCGAAHPRRSSRGRLQGHRRQDLDLLCDACRHLLPAGARAPVGRRPGGQGRYRHPADRHEITRDPGQADTGADRPGRHPRGVLRRRLRSRASVGSVPKARPGRSSISRCRTSGSALRATSSPAGCSTGPWRN